jgi:sucrose-6-phosphate hydrolase SacC (GH32 family)
MSPDDPKYAGCKSLFWECPDMFVVGKGGNGDDVWVSKYSLDSCGDYFYTGVYDPISGLFTAGSWDIR